MLGIDKNINSKGTVHGQAPKQYCANHTGSRCMLFGAPPTKKLFVTVPRAPQVRAASAKGEWRAPEARAKISKKFGE